MRKNRRNRKNSSRTRGNRICIAAFLLTCSLMLGGCGVKKEKAADSELPEIIIGMDYFEPYSYQTSDGKYKGIDVELAKEAFQRLGYQPKFENIVWEDKDELLADGTVDCLCCFITVHFGHLDIHEDYIICSCRHLCYPIYTLNTIFHT